jgi:hypothetical protein
VFVKCGPDPVLLGGGVSRNCYNCCLSCSFIKYIVRRFGHDPSAQNVDFQEDPVGVNNVKHNSRWRNVLISFLIISSVLCLLIANKDSNLRNGMGPEDYKSKANNNMKILLYGVLSYRNANNGNWPNQLK